MQVGAISASQVGANKVVYSYSCHWAGVMYSVEYTCLICGWYPCHRFAPIVYTSESIYIGNLSLGYVEDSKGYDSIAI
jgi:hypothetical protein